MRDYNTSPSFHRFSTRVVWNKKQHSRENGKGRNNDLSDIITTMMCVGAILMSGRAPPFFSTHPFFCPTSGIAPKLIFHVPGCSGVEKMARARPQVCAVVKRGASGYEGGWMREVMRPFPAERPDYPRCDLAPVTVPLHSMKSSLLPIFDVREESSFFPERFH